MSHLHIPDGVLPPWLWGSGFVLALALLVISARALGPETPQRLAYRGALGALVLAAMVVEVPLGPFEYHLTLVGPVGVLLGAAGALQVVFVASAVLAFAGHGGLTVIGLNALVLGAGAALARPVYRAVARTRPGAASMAAGAALAQAAAGALWLAVMAVALRSRGWEAHAGSGSGRLALFAAIALPMWLAGIVIESTIAFGIGRFLARVRPDLLPPPFPNAKPSHPRPA